jgi:hypothetical protein
VVMGRRFDSHSEYYCPHVKGIFRGRRKQVLCKRVNHDGFPSCFVYDANGRLRFLCKWFVAPAGFLLRKQLSLETLKKTEATDSGSLNDSDFLERVS